MKTIPVDQISAMPLLLVFEILTAVIIFTVGILLVNKFLKQDHKKTLMGSILVGVIASTAMVGVFLAMDSHVNSTNEENIRAALTQEGETLTDEQITTLKNDTVVDVNADKKIVLTDEGSTYNVIIYDDSENAKTQIEEDKAKNKQIKENDF